MSEIEIFKKWLDYMSGICDLGVLYDAYKYVDQSKLINKILLENDFNKKNRNNNPRNIQYHVSSIEYAYDNITINYIKFKDFRRMLIIKNL